MKTLLSHNFYIKRCCFFSILSAIILLLSIHPSFAETSIAVVDIKYVLEKSTAAQGARKQIKVMRDNFLNDIKAKEKELRNAEQTLKKQQSILASEAFEKKIAEFKAKQTKIQEDIQNKRKKIDESLTKALGLIEAAVNTIIQDLANEKRFDVAIPSSQVLYANSSLYITTEVLDRLNKKLPSLKVK